MTITSMTADVVPIFKGSVGCMTGAARRVSDSGPVYGQPPASTQTNQAVLFGRPPRGGEGCADFVPRASNSGPPTGH
jgi:hypothetical protein